FLTSASLPSWLAFYSCFSLVLSGAPARLPSLVLGLSWPPWHVRWSVAFGGPASITGAAGCSGFAPV
ncbi:hypothetical protein, partial [Fodinibius halophilus]|uniref:hypothetical protein n=1 Tax=Fodinibius halophilus TaxID=1736908 RepID=UPI00197AA9CE